MSLCEFVNIGHAMALVTNSPAMATMKIECDKVIHLRSGSIHSSKCGSKHLLRRLETESW